MTKALWMIALAAMIAISGSLFALHRSMRGIDESVFRLGATPVTAFTATASPSGPIVIVAHGFAGSQQLMQPIALTLAQAGFRVLTFDFAGHGRNTQPMPGGLADMARSTQALLSDIGAVVAYARTLPGADKGVALVGHSMAADLAIQYAMQDRGIAAVVALSGLGSGVTADNPRNLLVITGAWEPEMLTAAGPRIVREVSGGAPEARRTYGDLAAGTGRRYALADGAEHIGVIYSRDGIDETVQWLEAAFGQPDAGFRDRRGPWLALLFAGLVALACPAARLLPVLARPPCPAGTTWRTLLVVGIAPAVLTPLILWKMPTDFLPILLGDYLVVHFAVYGALTAALALLLHRERPSLLARSASLGGLVVAAIAVAAWTVVALGWPIDTYVTSFVPTGARWWLIPAMFAGTAIYFVADETATRGAQAPRGGTVFTKLCFLLSLLAAVALNPQKLFFLIIIVPVILVLFTVFGLFSRWAFARTGDPRAAALGNAAALAYAIAVTFPVVGT